MEKSRVKGILFALFVWLTVTTCLIGTSLFYRAQENAYAEEEPQAELSGADKEIHRGETFSVPLSITENKGLITLFVTIKFNHDYFTLTDVKQKEEGLGSLNLEHSNGYDYIDEKTGGFNLFWDGNVPDKSTGKIAELTFESKMNIPLGSHFIEIEVSEKNTTKEYLDSAKVEAKDAEITVIEGAFIVVWQDWNGSAIKNDKIAGEHPYNPVTGGYEYNSGLSIDSGDYPDNPTREDNSKYSYEFTKWKGAVWEGDKPENSAVICYRADYKETAKQYNVWYYIDGEGEGNIPDGIIDKDAEWYSALTFDYNSDIDNAVEPKKANYTFYGWYTDPTFINKLNSPLMPDSDLILYGYYKFNIRETDIPKIELVYRETITDDDRDEIALVDVFVRSNWGLSSLFISVAEYDKESLTFCGYWKGEIFNRMSFFDTNVVDGVYPDNFNFSYNNSYVNSYETGLLLTLKYKINRNTKDGAYFVTMTSDPNNTTYVTDGEIWYSYVEFVGTKIPVGVRNSWEEGFSGGEKEIKVEAENPVPYNIDLMVEEKTELAEEIVSTESINMLWASSFEIHDIYDIYYVENGTKLSTEEYTATFGEQMLTIRIKLTEKQKNCKELELYSVQDGGILNKHECEIADGYLVFKTDTMGYWTITGNYNNVAGETAVSFKTKIFALIFAISCVCLIAIAFVRARKKQPLFSTEERPLLIPPRETETLPEDGGDSDGEKGMPENKTKEE